jgi:L-ascorbate metabolism protein UlaG (beta-lactamase superfamily)
MNYKKQLHVRLTGAGLAFGLLMPMGDSLADQANHGGGSVPSPIYRSAFSRAPYDGRRFSNLGGQRELGLAAGLRWQLTRRPPRWPEQAANDAVPRPVERVDDGSIRATLIGHATVLLQVARLNILTDPVWSPRVGPFSWLGVKRVRPPAIAFGDLPTIDAVLLSHDHYDHLDRPTLAALAHRDRPIVLTGLKVGRSVPSHHTVELDWWESYALNGEVRVTFVPAQHFSGRGLADHDASLWGGFVLQTPAGTVYFAGDTGDGPHFAAIRQRFGPITLSLIPIGAYAPRWFMGPVHIDPSEAVAASLTLESKVSLAIHFGTFPLADEAFDAPPLALAQALVATPGANRGRDFRIVPFGEPIVIHSD